MLQADDTSRMLLKEACYSLLTLAIGFLSCSIIAVLAYFTYQTAVGSINYCSRWTDIPGRLVIFLIFYYAAGVCGTLPIPERLRLNCLPQPFVLYRLESWKNLFRKLRLLFTFNCQMYEVFANDPEMSPLRDGSNARSYDSTPPTREQTENIPIATTETDTPRKYAVRSNKAARNRNLEVAGNPEERSMSIDSSMGGLIVPMAGRKCTKPPYVTDSTVSTPESSDKSIPNTLTESLYEVSGTSTDRAKTVKVCSETDTPPRTPDRLLPVAGHPRCDWSLLKHPNGVPPEAKALHKRHRMLERRELEQYNKKQKMEETAHSPKDEDSDWRTDSDELNPFAYRRLRVPVITARSKIGFRGRTKTTSGGILTSEKIKIHKRTTSCCGPHRNRSYEENKCCENSPDLQSKVKYIEKTTLRFKPSLLADSEASTSRQHTDAFPSKKSEASTSRQYVDAVHSKSCAGEASTSEQTSDTFSEKKSDSEVSTNKQYIEHMYQYLSSKNCVSETSTSEQNSDTLSEKKSDSEASTNKQYIEHMYQYLSSQKCDSNDESAESSVQTKSPENPDQ